MAADEVDERGFNFSLNLREALFFTISYCISMKKIRIESMNSISLFLLFIRVRPFPPIRLCIHLSPVFSFLIIRFSFLTTYLTLITTDFSRVTLVVSQHNKQYRRISQTVPSGVAYTTHEYCLQLPCVLQIGLISHTSVAHEPYKHRSRTRHNSKKRCPPGRYYS